jgi:hypothetical protein
MITSSLGGAVKSRLSGKPGADKSMLARSDGAGEFRYLIPSQVIVPMVKAILPESYLLDIIIGVSTCLKSVL